MKIYVQNYKCSKYISENIVTYNKNSLINIATSSEINKYIESSLYFFTKRKHCFAAYLQITYKLLTNQTHKHTEDTEATQH